MPNTIPVLPTIRALLTATLCLLALPSRAGARTVECDRVCLGRVLDGYLAALAAHDPKRLSLPAPPRVTENGRPVRLGEGAWKTATGFGSYRIRLIDPATQSAGFYGILEEGPARAVYFVRLKAPGGRIGEIETVIARAVPANFARAAAGLKTARPAFAQALAPADRGSRAVMIAAANSYYTGIEQSRGDVVAFALDCHRIENGVALVNNPAFSFDLVSPSGRKLPNFAAMGCRQQFDTGLWGTDAIAGRRFPLVDEKTGVVAAFTIYRSHAKARCAEVRGYGQVCPASPARADLDLVELFKIRGGQIHEMESIWTVIPTGQGSGW